MAVGTDCGTCRDAMETQPGFSSETDGARTTQTVQERVPSKGDYAVPPEFFPPPPARGGPLLPPRPPTCLPAQVRPVWPIPFASDATAQISRRLDLLVEEVARLGREVQALRNDLNDLRRR